MRMSRYVLGSSGLALNLRIMFNSSVTCSSREKTLCSAYLLWLWLCLKHDLAQVGTIVMIPKDSKLQIPGRAKASNLAGAKRSGKKLGVDNPFLGI